MHTQPPIIPVTEKEFAKGETIFRAAADKMFLPVPAEESLLAAEVRKHKARAVVVGVAPYRGELYQALGESYQAGRKLIARFGVGIDNLDKALARKHGIAIANTPGVLDQSVAEHAIWLIGCLARRLVSADASFRAGWFASEPGLELRGKRLGILGFGGIGRRVAAMAHFGFGMTVMAAGSRSPKELEDRERASLEQIRATWGVRRYTNDADSLFRECDVISVHLPLSEATRHFVNAARIGAMRPSALLVNTARGGVLDESALYDALKTGRIGGAALDVFEQEPYQPISPERDLCRLPNVVLIPHAGSNTLEANRRMAEACVANVAAFLAGQAVGLADH